MGSATELINLALNAVGLSALIGGVWYLAGLARDVKNIKENDLPHICEELKYLRGRLDEK